MPAASHAHTHTGMHGARAHTHAHTQPHTHTQLKKKQLLTHKCTHTRVGRIQKQTLAVFLFVSSSFFSPVFFINMKISVGSSRFEGGIIWCYSVLGIQINRSGLVPGQVVSPAPTSIPHLSLYFLSGFSFLSLWQNIYLHSRKWLQILFRLLLLYFMSISVIFLSFVFTCF